MKLRAFPSEIHKSLKLVRTAWSWESAAVSIARTHSAAFSQASAAGMIASRFGADSTGLMELSSTRFDTGRRSDHGPGSSVAGGVSPRWPGMRRADQPASGRWTAHSSFCWSRMAPTRRTMASSLGKMSTTSGHRLIFAVEALDRIRVVRFGAVLGREGHVGEHLGLVGRWCPASRLRVPSLP